MSLDLAKVKGTDAALRSALAAACLPTDDLAEVGRVFFRFSAGSTLVGFGGLEIHVDCALLRSVVVVPEQRRRGYGEAITHTLVEQARGEGASAVYLLTESATAFFERLGFFRIERRIAPAVILGSRQATSLCPASATLMVKTLKARSHVDV